MTPERQRIAIAEWCGWKKGNCGWWEGPQGQETPYLPDYMNDLNAIHEAEKKLTVTGEYRDKLMDAAFKGNTTNSKFVAWWNATADQRAEALLRTISKWEE